ncbi:MAG: thioredoxin fold domain-containing protein, partial [Christiangramia sp.]
MKKLLIFTFLLAAVSSLQAQEIKWMTMNEALVAQKKKPKKIFVDAYTNWCGPCKMLDKNTFSNKDVAEYINEHFYAVKFNAEGNETINFKDKVFTNPGYDPNRTGRNSVHQFASAMGVNAYPTMVFFSEEAGFLSPVKGYLTPQQLEIFLKIFATDDYKKVKTEEEWKKYQEEFEG